MPNVEELARILQGDKLTDYAINYACNWLKQFTKVQELHLTLYQRKKHNSKFVKDNLELIRHGSHWIVGVVITRINWGVCQFRNSLFFNFKTY